MISSKYLKDRGKKEDDRRRIVSLTEMSSQICPDKVIRASSQHSQSVVLVTLCLFIC